MVRSTIPGLVTTLLFSTGTAWSQVILPMTAHEAFHRVDPADLTQPARIVTLADHGFAPGQTLFIEPIGDWDNGPGGETFSSLMAVFSASATLLGTTLVARVPDAIDAGTDWTTIPTCPGNFATNIPQDFTVNAVGLQVVIPPGATHLFLAVRDCYYRDNTDPDGDYAVRLSHSTVSVSPPSVEGLALGAPYPNPARARVMIPCSLPTSTEAQITLHTVNGRLVRVLVDSRLPAGAREFVWDGRDAHGKPVPTGVYFARLATLRGELERRLVIVR